MNLLFQINNKIHSELKHLLFNSLYLNRLKNNLFKVPYKNHLLPEGTRFNSRRKQIH